LIAPRLNAQSLFVPIIYAVMIEVQIYLFQLPSNKEKNEEASSCCTNGSFDDASFSPSC